MAAPTAVRVPMKYVRVYFLKLKNDNLL